MPEVLTNLLTTKGTYTMNNTKHESAFARNGQHLPNEDYTWPTEGLTKAEYAAIHLCQPISGTPWLDEAIAQARRERLAGQALAAIVANSRYVPTDDVLLEARAALDLADALISALEGGEA